MLVAALAVPPPAPPPPQHSAMEYIGLGLVAAVKVPLAVMTVTLGAVRTGAEAVIAVLTNAVVATAMLLSAPGGVGACGVPVKTGEASGATMPLSPVQAEFCRA
jgi:hypothetical protein